MKLPQLFHLRLSLEDETNIQLVGASSCALPEMLLALTRPPPPSLSVRGSRLVTTSTELSTVYCPEPLGTQSGSGIVTSNR